MDGMIPEDLYELAWVSDPRVSPDGTLVAYVVNGVDREANAYRGAIWIAPTDGSGRPWRLTAGAKRDSSPRWSPDGSNVAFVSNREKDAAQLYVIPLRGGEPARLTSLDEDVSDPAWSPDGRTIVFAARVRDPGYEEKDERKRRPRRITRLQFKLDDEGWIVDRRRHVFTVAADGSGPPLQVTEGDAEDESPAWSPDGSRIVFVSAREPDWDTDVIRDLYVVPEGGGDPTCLTGGDGVCASPSWSPDGSHIAYLFTPDTREDTPHHARVALLEVGSGERRLLTESLDRNCAPFPTLREPIWDGADLLFGVEDRGNTHLYRVPADGSGDAVVVVGGDQSIAGYDVAAGCIVTAMTMPVAPPELYSSGLRLTDVGRGLRESRELVSPERFTARSPDGSMVDAWIMKPAGFVAGARYPVLLNIHGGPFTQYGNRFFDEFQVYAGAGYVVVFSNPRGSSGYSEEWGRAIRGPGSGGPGWGSVDYEDVMAVLEEATRRFDYCDPDRAGVMGGSYGGFMTSWIVGHTDRFRAACSERALNYVPSFYGSSDSGWTLEGYSGVDPIEDPVSATRISPVAYADAIQTPLLIIHSEEDQRTHVEQAEQLFTALRMRGREVEFVRFPAETHELSRSGSPAHRIMRFQIVLEWFDRHLRA